jgi:hypothetical protein
MPKSTDDSFDCYIWTCPKKKKIMKHLCFTGNNEVIVESPDITNIKLTSKCIPNNDILDNIFSWLIEDLKKKKRNN